MPSGMEIGRRKILGEYSNGMLCSPGELELSDDERRDPRPRPTAAPGTPIKDALGIESDVLWDLEINPNRPDAMSVAGVARDLAARYDESVHAAAVPPGAVGAEGRRALDPHRGSTRPVRPLHRRRCIRGVTVGPSPPLARPPAHAARACGRSTTSSTSPTT